MWVIAGVLLGILVLAAILGFHTGPHSHLVAGAAGVIAAAWLIVMALEGRSSSVLWTLFTADLLISVGVGFLAWRALSFRRTEAGAPSLRAPGRVATALEGAEATVVRTLSPEGVVRVRGEQWTAVALNGAVAAGAKVRVVSVDGMRLEVWAEGNEPAAGSPDSQGEDGRRDVNSLFTLEDSGHKNGEAAP
jgi:membrane-bound ClpP family serine protease